MKKLAFILFALVALGLGGGGVDGAPRQFRVGIVLEPAGTNVTYGRLLVAGLERAVRRLGIDGEAVAPEAKEGYLPSFLSFARQHYDLVIGWSGEQATAIDAVALRFPHVRFVYLDVPRSWLPHRPKNVWSVTFAEQQAGYLAGYLAGLMETRRAGADVVGAVGGFKFPPVDHYIAGFQAGAKSADPAVRTLVGYSGDFLDAAICRRIAVGQIAKGAGVVFDVAGACGLGTLQAAEERHVWGIGVDVDQSSLGPHVLTSALKRIDVAVFEAIRATQAGRFAGGRTTVLGLREGAVGLGKISSKVPRRFLGEIERIRGQIVSGKIVVPAVVR